MTELSAFTDRFIASWNEPDSERRAAAAKESFAVDAQYHNANETFVGLDRCVAAVDQAYEAFVPAGHTFTPNGDPAGHHDAVTFRWRMTAGADGDPVATGQMFALLDEEHKIRLLYQFLDQ